MGFLGSIGDAIGKIVKSDTAKSIFTPSNVIDAVGIFGAIKGQQNTAQISAQTAKDQFANQITLQNMAQQGDMQKLQASLAGQAGMAAAAQAAAAQIAAMQIAAAKKQAEFQGRIAAKQGQVTANQAGGNATLQALQNLIGATQRPLVR